MLPTDNFLQLLRITQAAVSFQQSTYSSLWQLQQGLSWENTSIFHLAVVSSVELVGFPMEMLQSHLPFLFSGFV